MDHKIVSTLWASSLAIALGLGANASFVAAVTGKDWPGKLLLVLAIIVPAALFFILRYHRPGVPASEGQGGPSFAGGPHQQRDGSTKGHPSNTHADRGTLRW